MTVVDTVLIWFQPTNWHPGRVYSPYSWWRWCANGKSSLQHFSLFRDTKMSQHKFYILSIIFLGGRNWKRQNWCKYLTAIYLEYTIFPPQLGGSFDLHHSADVSCLSSAGLQYSSDPDCVWDPEGSTGGQKGQGVHQVWRSKWEHFNIHVLTARSHLAGPVF